MKEYIFTYSDQRIIAAESKTQAWDILKIELENQHVDGGILSVDYTLESEDK